MFMNVRKIKEPCNKSLLSFSNSNSVRFFLYILFREVFCDEMFNRDIRNFISVTLNFHIRIHTTSFIKGK